jgi:hypothetical protein
MERIDNIDFEATTARARRMTDEELIWSVYDAAEAADLAEALERDGCPVSKTGGYYRDEAMIYRAELRRRQKDTK